MECLLLRIKCKAAYNHLRDQKILPLPSLSTMRRLLSCMPCTFGLNSFALSAIKRTLSDKPRAERMGSLVLDEMSIASSVEFNSQELKFDGFVDFGDLVTIDEQSNSLSDHALVLMFRPYRSNWVQPIGVFASKGAAPGEILHEIIIKAITALNAHAAVVKSLVCDGAQPNKKLATLLGISGQSLTPDSSCSFSSPTDDVLSDGAVTDAVAESSFHHIISEEKIFFFLMSLICSSASATIYFLSKPCR